MKTRQQAITYGLTFPHTYVESPFKDPNWELVRVKGSKKAFLWVYEKDGYINLNIKVDPEWREFWREAYDAVIPGYHQNKKYWNTIILDGTIPEKDIKKMIKESNDMYVSIDLVEEVIERQLRKYKNKIVDKQQESTNFQKAYLDKDYEEDEEVKIIRTKKFGIKPMYPEDACVQMELLGHNFFVFFNAETEQVNVVYKRKGNTYGLIEPEF